MGTLALASTRANLDDINRSCVNARIPHAALAQLLRRGAHKPRAVAIVNDGSSGSVVIGVCFFACDRTVVEGSRHKTFF